MIDDVVGGISVTEFLRENAAIEAELASFRDSMSLRERGLRLMMQVLNDHVEWNRLLSLD